MKKIGLLLFLLVAFSQTFAQETVAPSPKKLQQLYLSLGTGTAVTKNEYSNPNGGTAILNFTGAFGPSNIFRVNIQHSGFTNRFGTTPGAFDYLQFGRYDSEFFVSNEGTAISFTYGKRQQINKLVQVQGLAGVGTNFISTFEIDDFGIIDGRWCGTPYIRNYIYPGLLLQAEAMFLPTKFSGLTVGAYANLTPKLPTAGVNLSLNLGLLK